MRRSLLLPLLLSTVGCASQPTREELRRQLDAIEPGRTTCDELRALCDDPATIEFLDFGVDRYLYEFRVRGGETVHASWTIQDGVVHADRALAKGGDDV